LLLRFFFFAFLVKFALGVRDPPGVDR
jgi:hypothetical protein